MAEGEVVATFTIPQREITRLTTRAEAWQLPEIWREHVQSRVQLGSCKLLRSEAIPSSEEYARTRMKWHCPATVSSFNITLNTMFDQVPSHVHFANFRLPEGGRRERLFSQFEREFILALASGEAEPADGGGPVLTTYIRFGFEHILIGLDHIAFLLTLLLLPGSWRQLLWVITGFTLGHSITLSLSTLGLVTPDMGFTEALIGLSIALVAIENVSAHSAGQRLTAGIVGAILLGLALLSLLAGGYPPALAMLGLALFCWCYLQLSDSPARARQLRPGITGLFGLIHGFGFASVLMEVGLPETSRPIALLGFNIGVELGQLLIVALFLIAGRLLRAVIGRPYQGAAIDFLSAALCALGVYWFLQRLYFYKGFDKRFAATQYCALGDKINNGTTCPRLSA